MPTLAKIGQYCLYCESLDELYTQNGGQNKKSGNGAQFENSSKPETITQTIDNYVGSSSMTATHTTGKKREIISWGQIGIEPTAVTGGWPDEYVRDHQFYLTYFLNQSSTQKSIFRHYKLKEAVL